MSVQVTYTSGIWWLTPPRPASPLQDLPALLLRDGVEAEVRGDGGRGAHEIEPGGVRVGVAVAVGLLEVRAVLGGVLAQPVRARLVHQRGSGQETGHDTGLVLVHVGGDDLVEQVRERL